MWTKAYVSADVELSMAAHRAAAHPSEADYPQWHAAEPPLMANRVCTRTP